MLSHAKTKKRKRETDPNYPGQKRQRRSNKANSTAISQMRSNTKENVIDEKGNEEAKKTAIVFNSKIAKELTPKRKAKFTSGLQTAVAEIPGNRPIEQFLKFDQQGIPLEAETPGKTKLFKQSYNGLAIHFSNEFNPVSPPKIGDLKDEKKFTTSEEYKTMKKNTGKTEFSAIQITEDLLKKSAIEIQTLKEETGKNRICSQASQMAAEGVSERKVSATRYAHATEESFFPQLKWEILHFIGHQFLASKSQDEKNMGCGSFNSNTEMLHVEVHIPELVKLYPKGLWIKTNPQFINNTQILSSITYTIETDDFAWPFVFDAQKTKRPDYSNQKYIGALVKTIGQLKNGNLSTPQQMTQHPNLLFSPHKNDSIVKTLDFNDKTLTL